MSGFDGRANGSACRHLRARFLGPLRGGPALRLEVERLVCAWLDQPDLVGEDHRLNAVAEPQLVEQMRNMRLYRGVADLQLASDLWVGHAWRQETNRHLLAVGEAIEVGP